MNRNEKISEEAILAHIKENSKITYKFYEIALDDQTKTYVNTIEEAITIIEQIKSQYSGDANEMNLQIIEKYTENKDEIKNNTIEIAQKSIKEGINRKSKAKSDEEITISNLGDIHIATTPVKGTITSRYGESSRRRSSTHTGIDIANKTGTDIKVIADGTVTFAGESGSYGKIVKISHGEGIETWYAHCSKIYTSVGNKVKAGDVISAVGSTGNSTGPHLHLEIRINGRPVNPQEYLYK